PTSEVRDIRLSIRPLHELFGTLPARDFGPLQLKAVRQAIIESGLCRNEVNKRTRRLVRLFGWGVESAPYRVRLDGPGRGRCQPAFAPEFPLPGERGRDVAAGLFPGDGAGSLRCRSRP